ncbi:carboxyl transferase domain-containing protein [Brevibacterium daeguense]|uniref:Carboxyl transferase domain-containing protein n=1 Tax=Brevibacterium daeguense TaxID=909936 RepID=A0ABP8EFH8_9MICO|nr:carboxyl transferase domain-containing protein [Brevibacterium daeguense]
METLLVANRGEIATRIIRTASAMGLRTVSVHPKDDVDSFHVRHADIAVELSGIGPQAYLNINELISVAREQGADFIHPGYGFLAESAALAQACEEASIQFLGPASDVLRKAADKAESKRLAQAVGIPVSESTDVLAEPEPALDLLSRSTGGIAIKALAGGGGRGIRVVHAPDDVESAIIQCSKEAEFGFGDNRVFAEKWWHGARHVEVQCVAADGDVYAIGDRDCSLQRRRQKVIEIAPAPGLRAELRAALHSAAVSLLKSMDYQSLATVEFLVREDEWVFMEVNPRIQVEHTITEAVTGLDLVELQIAIARGDDLAGYALHSEWAGTTSGFAIEARVNSESLSVDGEPQPSTGVLQVFDLPSGPAVRVDTWAGASVKIGALYDTLLAKVICSSDTFEGARKRLVTALQQFRIEGVQTTREFLLEVLSEIDPEHLSTGWIDENAGSLVRRSEARISSAITADGSAARGSAALPEADAPRSREGRALDLGPRDELVVAPLSGTVVSLDGRPGELGLIEAMKMHHPISAPPHESAVALVDIGDPVMKGDPVFIIQRTDSVEREAQDQSRTPHPQLEEVIKLHENVRDEHRPHAVAKIHQRNRRTARENLADLVIPGSFVEYAPLAIAAQAARRSLDDLIENTSGDGLLCGIGKINTGAGVVDAAVLSYDYMVMAGTQGTRGHAKIQRLLRIAGSRKLPIVFFAEGGGGRPGETDRLPGAHLNGETFALMARLTGVVPMIAVVSGRCFAGNAAIAGLADVLIATEDASIGLGGPAMVEGGGLGKFRAEEIGPAKVHAANGVIDLLVRDDAAAVAATKTVLGYLTGCSELAGGETGAPQPDDSRTVIPSDRLRAFEIRDAIRNVVDLGSFVELRRGFAPGAIVGFARVENNPFVVIANDNHHLGGAIDVDAALSFNDMLTLAERHRLPVVSFVDTPGFIVGPEAETEPGVRVFGKFFSIGANLTTPLGAIIVRKGYGLGAMAMTGGSFVENQFTIAWPSGEIGSMGLEGAVRLGFSKELEAIEDPAARQELYEELVAKSYDQGRAIKAAMLFDIDDVIDPADTRRWIETLFV